MDYGSGNNLPIYQLQWNQTLNPHPAVFWSIAFSVDTFSLIKPHLKAVAGPTQHLSGSAHCSNGSCLGWKGTQDSKPSPWHPFCWQHGDSIYKQRGNTASLTARKSVWHQVRSRLFWGQETIWARQKRRESIRRSAGRGRRREFREQLDMSGIFGFSVYFRKGMACLKMATGISQAVLLIQPSPSGVSPTALHQWYSWMNLLAGWHTVLHEEQATGHQTDRPGTSVKTLTLQNIFRAAEWLTIPCVVSDLQVQKAHS